MATETTATSSATATAPAPTPAPSSAPSKIVFRVMQSLVLLVVLIGSVITIAWFVLNPLPPAIRLDSLSLSGLPNASDISSPPPKLHVRIQLNASNPNKKLALVIQDVDDLVIQDVDDLPVVLFHHGHWFRLPSHNATSPSENCISKRGCGVLTFEAEARLRPGHGKRRKSSYRFTQGSAVRMKVTVKFIQKYWPSKRASVDVRCENLSIGISPSTCTGELKDGGKDCWVGFA